MLVLAGVRVTVVGALRMLLFVTVSPGTARTLPPTVYAPGLNPFVFQLSVTVMFVPGAMVMLV